MTMRSVAAHLGVVASIIIASMLLDREGMSAAPAVTSTSNASVEVEGDTIPVAGLPQEVVQFLEEGRSWRAARALRSVLRNTPSPNPELVLVAARSEAGWGGWERTQDLLEGQEWLDQVWGGEGWFWLGRARDENGDSSGALEAYDRFLAQQGDSPSGHVAVAELRRGLVLLRLGRGEEGATALQSSQDELPGIDVWLELLAAEALAEAGDTAATGAFAARAPDEAGIRHRARAADIEAHEQVGDIAGARQAALSYSRAGGSAGQQADLAVTAARFARQLGDNDAARRELLAVLEPTGTAAAREAANILLELGGLSADDRLKIAQVYERHGNAARAVDGYRAWLASGSGNAARREEITLALGRALFNAGNYAAAEQTLRPLHSGSAAVAAEALLLTGRSEYRRGAQNQAFATFGELGRRFPGSPEGAEGLFLVADLSHDDGEIQTASSAYRNVAANFRGHDRAGLSLMRLGGLSFLRGQYPQAAAIWEEYRSTYPRGDRWLEATFWAARSYEAAGDMERARSLYRAIRQREPISYYALRSMRRLNEPYWPVPMGEAPQTTPEQQQTVDEWMRVVDVLRESGLHTEADSEAERLSQAASGSTGLLYGLAEALNERGYAIRGIQIGQRLERQANQLNPRLLRILYPFPYRELIEAEAREKGLDPFLVAALTRQESLFTRRISSPVGARGLMQIMPETGQALARGVGIDEWDAELLFNPEINVHLGTRYLEEQMEKYDEDLPSVFSAYNAGPHRIDVWRRFPEFEDTELFTERIPYRETRNYVKILTRNMALYSGLYGEEVSAESAQ